MLDTIHRLPTVLKTTGLSRSTIYEQVAKGIFPKPIKIGKRAVGWRNSDLCAWLEAKAKPANDN